MRTLLLVASFIATIMACAAAVSADDSNATLQQICPKGASLYARAMAAGHKAAAASTMDEQNNLALQQIALLSAEGDALLDCSSSWIGKNAGKVGFLEYLAANAYYGAANTTRIIGLDNRSKLEIAFDAASLAVSALSDDSLAGNSGAAALRRSADTLIQEIKNAEGTPP